MNILTLYSKDAIKFLSVLDDISRKVSVKVLAADPQRMYNDENHFDDNLLSVTFKTDSDYQGVSDLIKSHDVYLCEEDPEDWE